MGLSFKENCNDVRNTQVINLYRNLQTESSNVHIYDPIIKERDAYSTYNIKLITSPNKDFYDAIIIAVAHNIFRELGLKKIKSFCRKNSIIYDLKYLLPAEDSDIRL